jgi:hypothetical protein
MSSSEEHQVVKKSQFGSYSIHAEAPLFLSTISFFALPLVMVEFLQSKSMDEMLAVGFASVIWMLATLVGIKRIPDVGTVQHPAASVRLRRACVLQVALLALGAAVLWWCTRFSAN